MQQDILPGKIVRVYLDLETEDLSATTLLQLSSITENNITFNAYVNPQKELTYHCFRFTKLHYLKGILYKEGEEVFSVELKVALQTFKDWLDKLNAKISIIAFNGLGFDNQAILKHFRLAGIEFPTCVVQFEDPLPCFKKLFKNKKLENFRLGTLAGIYGVPLVNAHDSRDDCKCLKELVEKVCKEEKLSID